MFENLVGDIFSEKNLAMDFFYKEIAFLQNRHNREGKSEGGKTVLYIIYVESL